jgi:hypothetical protein
VAFHFHDIVDRVVFPLFSPPYNTHDRRMSGDNRRNTKEEQLLNDHSPSEGFRNRRRRSTRNILASRDIFVNFHDHETTKLASPQHDFRRKASLL